METIDIKDSDEINLTDISNAITDANNERGGKCVKCEYYRSYTAPDGTKSAYCVAPGKNGKVHAHMLFKVFAFWKEDHSEGEPEC